MGSCHGHRLVVWTCQQCRHPSSKSPEMEAGRVVMVLSKSPNRMCPMTAMRMDTASTVYPTSRIHGKAYKESTVLPCSYLPMTGSCAAVSQSGIRRHWGQAIEYELQSVIRKRTDKKTAQTNKTIVRKLLSYVEKTQMSRHVPCAQRLLWSLEHLHMTRQEWHRTGQE